MSDSSPAKVIGIFLLVIVIVTLAFLAVQYDDVGHDEQRDTSFHLGSTYVEIGVGETCTVDTSADKSEWRSMDESIATVSDGSIKGVSVGKTDIEVTSDGYTKTVTVNVLGKTPERKLTVYNPYSNDYDKVVLGKGFTDGILALSFNRAGEIVICLAGTDKGMLDFDASFLGTPNRDFDRAVMAVYDSQGKKVLETEYRDEDSSIDAPFDSLSDVTYTEEPYNLVFGIGNLGYGDYTVVYTLYHGDRTYSIEGYFEYGKGDGRYDNSTGYHRVYSWRADCDNNGKVEEFHMDVEYSMSGFFLATLENDTDTGRPFGSRNYSSYDDMERYLGSCPNVDTLEKSLRKVFINTYLSPAKGMLYATFLTVFVQMAFGYEYDDMLYGSSGLSLSDTDYWALPDQTIYSGYGDCEDTSILLAVLFRSAGYDSAIYILPGHAMAAVAIDVYTGDDIGYIHNGKKFYLCETTVDAPYAVSYSVDRGNESKHDIVYVIEYYTSLNSIPYYLDTGKYVLRYEYVIGDCNQKYVGETYYFYETH